MQNLGLTSIYDTCLRYLYVMYCTEHVPGIDGKGETTIGECNIKPIKYATDSTTSSKLFFRVFIQDSIPVSPYQKMSSGNMINGFQFDKNKKSLQFALTDENTKEYINDIQKIYRSTINDPDFEKYLRSYKQKLHPKFAAIIDVIEKD